MLNYVQSILHWIKGLITNKIHQFVHDKENLCSILLNLNTYNGKYKWHN